MSPLDAVVTDTAATSAETFLDKARPWLLRSPAARRASWAAGTTTWPARTGGRVVVLDRGGLVKAARPGVGGRCCVLGLRAAGDVLGWNGMGEDAGATPDWAIAVGSACGWSMSPAEFERILSAAGLESDFRSVLAAVHDQQHQVMSELLLLDARHRLAACLARIPHVLARAGVGHDGCALTHEDLGGMVGTTRSRVGIFLAEFRHEGWVRCRPGLFEVVDPSALRAFAASAGEPVDDRLPRPFLSSVAPS